MVTIEIAFLAGRFHATPWGRNVNEGVPEWPPSPYRILRALFDTWKRKRADWAAERVEPILAALASEPPRFRLPRASASHTRAFLSVNAKETSKRSKIFDAFVIVQPAEPVLICWPSVSFNQQTARDLDDLLGVLNYLGRSESWVLAHLRDDAIVAEWNCVPAQGEWSEGVEGVRVACAIPRDEYGASPYQRTVRSERKTKMEPTPWLEALAWTTDDLFAARRSEPPAMRYVAYLRPARCFDVEPARATLRLRSVHGALFAMASKVRAPVTATIEIAEALRRRLMGIHKRIIGGDGSQVSPRFSGKNAAGKPLEGHPHVYILPLDLDRDGWMDHVIVGAREPLEESEVQALDVLRAVHRHGGRPELRLVALRFGTLEDLFRAAYPKESEARLFRSTTPFITPRQMRRGRGADWLEAEVRREARNHFLPEPVRIAPLARLTDRGGREIRWLQFRRNRREDAPRPGFGFEIEFAACPRRLVAIGYASHFGLGQFEPLA